MIGSQRMVKPTSPGQVDPESSHRTNEESTAQRKIPHSVSVPNSRRYDRNIVPLEGDRTCGRED